MKKFGINDYVSSALILLALTILTHSTGLFSRVDYILFDLGQKLHHQSAPADIIIVGIDENSLSQLGRWLWSQHTHAALLNQLHNAGAAAIGLDIIFSEVEPNDENHAGDKALAAAIKQAGNVVLPVMI